MFGCVGGFIVAVFGALLFPASISEPSQGESIAAFSMQAFFLISGIGGFAMCWRYTKRFADKDRGSSRSFT